MKKKMATMVWALLMLMLMEGCGNGGGKSIPTPTPQIKPGTVVAATPTPAIAVQESAATPEPTFMPSSEVITTTPKPTTAPTAEPTKAATATPKPTTAPTAEPTKAATATPKPTTAPTAEPTKAATATPKPTTAPTAEPTKAATATPKPTTAPTAEPTKVATATPKPTSIPTPEPTKAADSESKTEDVYENEWLGLRFVAPKDVYVVQEEDILFAAYWPEDGIILQLTKEEATADYATAEEYAEEIKREAKLLSGYGMSYAIESDLALAEIAEREYINVVTSIETEDGKMYQDYFIREQDGSLIVLALFYGEKDLEEKQEVLDYFSEY